MKKAKVLIRINLLFILIEMVMLMSMVWLHGKLIGWIGMNDSWWFHIFYYRIIW